MTAQTRSARFANMPFSVVKWCTALCATISFTIRVGMDSCSIEKLSANARIAEVRRRQKVGLLTSVTMRDEMLKKQREHFDPRTSRTRSQGSRRHNHRLQRLQQRLQLGGLHQRLQCLHQRLQAPIRCLHHRSLQNRRLQQIPSVTSKPRVFREQLPSPPPL